MSAEEATSATSATAGPVEVFVAGQEAPTAAEVKTTAAPAEGIKAVGLEEKEGEGKDRETQARPKAGVQDRIDELTRARREAEREAEYWKVRAQGTGAQDSAKAADPNKPPVRTDFQNDEDYLDARADFKVEQKLAEREQKQNEVKAQESKAGSWQSKLELARAEIPDYDQVMNGPGADMAVASHVAGLIMEHDDGAKITHHLASHPDELAKLNDMSPAKAAFELGRLATKFAAVSQETASSSKPAAERVSKAPAPAARAVGSGRSTTTPLGEQSMDEYIASRRSQGAGWAR